LLHNHPSGDPTPSREDIRVTRKILEAGEMLEIRLADHPVIGDRCYTSMKEAGYLESYERE
jgi:DNA repair protein RadC